LISARVRSGSCVAAVVVTIALALTSCRGPPVALTLALTLSSGGEPVAPQERDAFSASLVGWRSAGNPAPGECLVGASAELVTDVHEFKKRCIDQLVVESVACVARNARAVFGQPGGVLVLVTPGHATDGAAIIHEALHALVRCTATGPEGDPFDAAHSLPSVWEASGKEASAEQRARAPPLP
jgi:hypothetical protein